MYSGSKVVCKCAGGCDLLQNCCRETGGAEDVNEAGEGGNDGWEINEMERLGRCSKNEVFGVLNSALHFVG